MKTKISQFLSMDYKGQKYVVGGAALFAAVAYLFVVAPQVMAAALLVLLALAIAVLVLTHCYPDHVWAARVTLWLERYGVYTQVLLSAMLAGFLFLSLFVSPAAITVATVYAMGCAYLEYLAAHKASATEVVHDADSGVGAPRAEAA